MEHPCLDTTAAWGGTISAMHLTQLRCINKDSRTRHLQNGRSPLAQSSFRDQCKIIAFIDNELCSPAKHHGHRWLVHTLRLLQDPPVLVVVQIKGRQMEALFTGELVLENK